MKIKLLLTLLIGVLFGLGWWSLIRGPAGGALRPEGPVPEDPGRAHARLEDIDEDGAPRRVEREAAASSAPLAHADGAAAQADPWAADLGGVVGRVVEEDASPVAGISVCLVQVDAGLLLASDWQALGEAVPDLVVARTRTDEDGYFRLDGAYDASFQGLGIDLRGPRSTLRIVEQQVHGGERVDLGDIVLAAGCSVSGRVVDESGKPVAGARVRVTPVPKQGLAQAMSLGLQDFRADCAVGITAFVKRNDTSPVIEPPPIVRRHLDDLPFPTTHTDDEGRYRLEGAPIGRMLIAVDQRGRPGVLRLEQTEPGENELADAVLGAGRTIGGIVLDAAGDPLAGIEVMAGTEIAGAAAILQPAGVTGADGRFAVHGCPPGGDVMACARRRAGEAWVGIVSATPDQLEIELADTVAVTVRVFDFAGRAVSGAQVGLAATSEPGSPMHYARRFALLGAEPRRPRFEEVEPGVYVATDVAPGLYEVRAQPAELPVASRAVELQSGTEDVVLTCDPGRFLDLTVIDAATGNRVEHARASLVRTEVDLLTATAVARTERDGTARLGPFGTRVFDWEEGEWKEQKGPAQLLVQHPRYADAVQEVQEAVRAIEVRLLPGGEVHGRIHWGPDPPASIYTVVLERQRRPDDDVAQVFLPPRMALSGLDGTFRFTNLPAGSWELTVHERWLAEDPLTLMVKEARPVMLYRQKELLVEAGMVVPVTVDLLRDGGGRTARLEGTVRLDGAPCEGANVHVFAPGTFANASSDATGSYRTPLFLCPEQAIQVQVEKQVLGYRTVLFAGSFEAEVGSVQRLDVDVISATLDVEVRSRESGAPIVGARVTLRVEGSTAPVRGKTDSRGQARLVLVGSGTASVAVTAESFSPASREVEISAGNSAPLEVFELGPPTVCSGVCDLSRTAHAGVERAYLLIDVAGKPRYVELDMSAVSRRGLVPFEVSGIAPGSYTARIALDGTLSDPIPLELPPGGGADIVLRHP